MVVLVAPTVVNFISITKPSRIHYFFAYFFAFDVNATIDLCFVLQGLVEGYRERADVHRILPRPLLRRRDRPLRPDQVSLMRSIFTFFIYLYLLFSLVYSHLIFFL